MSRPAAEALRRPAVWFASLGCAAGLASGQAPAPTAAAPTIAAAFAGAALSNGAPGLQWLGAFLHKRPEWPAGHGAAAPFVLELSAQGLRLAAEEVALAAGTIAAGAVTFADGARVLWSCAMDGTEDWFVPHDLPLPDGWSPLLRSLDADVLGQPRTLDLPVAVGHFAGAWVDGDPRTELLRLGAAQCGEVTWIAWRTPSHLRVRGRSQGGLLLPAVLLLLADASPAPAPATLPLRAFAARDGDRAEAARQLVRLDDPVAPATLRALLLGDDALRLTAIDALVRRRASDELPRIVAAATPSTPWAAVAAADALRELWPDASPAVRKRTRAALARSACVELRRVDPESLPTAAGDRGTTAATNPPGEAPRDRLRLLVLLGLTGTALYGCWLRERALQRLQTI